MPGLGETSPGTHWGVTSMFSLLHCADLHLEAGFASSGLPPAVGNQRRADLRATLGRILALAREHNVDAVTIAGDLYEQAYATPDTAEFLRRQFADLAPIRVFIAPGDSDPYTGDSLYALTRWPDNVRVFPPGPLTALELAPDIQLWGAAHPPEPAHRTLKNWRADTAGTNLLLLHAAHSGLAPREGQGLFQVDAAMLRAAGIDLALLGHDHNGHSERERGVDCVYPGSPEPLAPGEADGEHQVVLITIDDGACQTRGLPVSQWRYEALRLDLSGCSSPEEAAALLAIALQNLPGGADEHTLCGVTLTGDRHFTADLETIRAAVDTAAHLELEYVHPKAHDVEHLADEPTVRGLVVRRFQDHLASAAGDAERVTAMQALDLALRALDGRQVRADESG